MRWCVLLRVFVQLRARVLVCSPTSDDGNAVMTRFRQ